MSHKLWLKTIKFRFIRPGPGRQGYYYELIKLNAQCPHHHHFYFIYLHTVYIGNYSDEQMLYGECFVDSASPNRIWENEWQNKDLFFSETITIESCRAFCAAKDFIYFGVQATYWCLCGNTSPSSSLQTSKSDCKPCTGNPSQLCGGPYRMNIYTINNQG